MELYRTPVLVELMSRAARVGNLKFFQIVVADPMTHDGILLLGLSGTQESRKCRRTNLLEWVICDAHVGHICSRARARFGARAW